MPEPTLVIFDDSVAQRWEPFALTRPIGELLFGARTLRERAETVFEARCVAVLSAEHLSGLDEEGAPRVHRLDEAPRDGARIFLLSRFVPAWRTTPRATVLGDQPARLMAGGRTVGWYAPPGTPAPDAEVLQDPDGAEDRRDGGAVTLEGEVVEHVWELIERNPGQLAIDLEALHPTAGWERAPEGVHQFGRHPVILGQGARIEPGAVLDSREGAIWLDEGARVDAFTRLAGPAWVGPGSAVLGGRVEAASIGPVCRVHGELAETVCLGYVNKQHDGHLGHAYLGRWVNLGAGTTNSDLKNNYGTIRVWSPTGEADTGLIKLGCLLGDHVKTGIGLLLNTGTVVGAGSNLFGAAMPPKYVPPFSWGSGDELVEFRLDKFLEVAERAMGRRGVQLSAGQRGVLEQAWSRSRGAGA
jgi:UDP-N-acetylglucosamine diphosphorylase / glucose-1-phosphate thymidylyltransferase / UDP-N-acetylgalactosamine diphosphorylase / glucosamine-1-phosphate N-acetyltransferase / galactosamine-1-phosphate N-acetyltransferase